MAQKSTLIFITAEYPYGKGETFIEEELKVLANHFDEIIILPAEIGPNSNMEIRDYPSNCTISVRRNAKKSKLVLQISRLSFLKMLFSEMAYIRKNLHVKIRVIHLKIAIKSYYSALIIKNSLEQICKNLNSEKLFLFSYWMGDGLLASILAKRSMAEPDAVKVLSRAHGWDLYFERHEPAYLPWRKIMIGKCDAIFCISKDGQKYLREKFPDVPVDKIKLAYLGVPASPKHSKIPDFTINGLRIISCSSAIKLKRVDLILAAILKMENINIYWTHIGDGPLLEELKMKATGIMKDRPDISITFAGYLAPDKRDELLGSGAFHLFINASKSEGVPVSVMEAMSFGIPVIATAVGGIPEIVKDGHNGFLLSQNPDPQEIAQTIKKFYILSFEQKEVLRQNAYKTWEEDFDAKKNYMAFKIEIMNI